MELELAAVGTSDEEAADGILRPVPGVAGAELEIPRVLMKERGEDGGCHQSADAAVGEGCGVAFAVAFETLAVGRLTVGGLPHQGNYAKERDSDGVGHGFHGELEFGSCGEGAELIVFFDGRVVREDVA